MVLVCGVVPFSICVRACPNTENQSAFVIVASCVKLLPFVLPLTICPPLLLAISSIAAVCHDSKFARFAADALPYRTKARIKFTDAAAITSGLTSTKQERLEA